MNSDPISDFLTRIRNASMVNKSTVSIPHSKFKHELSKLLKTEGYISDVKVNGESSQKELQIDLKYSEPGTEVEVGKIDGHQKRISAKVVAFPHFDPKKTRVRS